MDITELRQYGAQIYSLANKYHAFNPRVFGSVARNSKQANDIDLLFSFEPCASLLDEAGLERELTLLLGKKVDLIGDDTIRDEFKPFILSEAIPL